MDKKVYAFYPPDSSVDASRLFPCVEYELRYVDRVFELETLKNNLT